MDSVSASGCFARWCADMSAQLRGPFLGGAVAELLGARD